MTLGFLTAGCGDDDAPSDGGPSDASMDAEPRAEGGFIRPRDAQNTSGDPLPECDRFDPLACSAGESCQVVIRRAAGEEQFLIYSGCVEGVDPRGGGDPCVPLQLGGSNVPYKAEGLEDEVYVDQCDEGLFCAPDPDVRGHFSCQRSCESGRFAGQVGMVCPSDTEFCTGRGTFEEVCRQSDECDPTSPQSCGPGSGCYLRLNDTGTGLLTVCLAQSPMPLADGEPCQFLDDCQPGSSCFAPARLPPARWTAEDLICRRSCIVGAEADAGAEPVDEDDAGVAAGTCGGGLSCVGFGSGLDLSAVSSALGQCEPVP